MTAPPARLRLTVPAAVTAIASASERLLAACPDLDPETASLLETALGEAMTNIVEHSLAGLPVEAFEVEISRSADGVEVRLEDRGRGLPPAVFDAMPSDVAFDPDDLARLPESGMGVALIKSIMDEVRYTQDAGTNRLHLWKRC